MSMSGSELLKKLLIQTDKLISRKVAPFQFACLSVIFNGVHIIATLKDLVFFFFLRVNINLPEDNIFTRVSVIRNV